MTQPEPVSDGTAPLGTKALIEASEITKQFGGLCAVDRVSIRVHPGEIVGLVGPDGAGKTTTLRLICGALRLDGGWIRVGGYDIQRQTEQARAQIGYLPQRFSLYEELTVMENIRFFAETRGVRREEWLPRCVRILEFVGLADFKERLAGKLSGGMKQKLGLAAALVHSPRVLLLDEPTTGVDPLTRQDFWQLIIRLAAQEQTAVLVSTPYMDEASRCHRVHFMRQGKILIEGAPAKLRASLAGKILEVKGEPLSLIRHLALQEAGVFNAQRFGDRLHLRVMAEKSEEVCARIQARAAQAGGKITSLRPIEAQLEDVFIALLEEDSLG
ncbi:MAG: multidrug ABC transporter ATP-binding protein [Anaerolineae bacterium]|jgi:ABC-2 type transport system ATP-binding protein|nr:MAG: multidrug ABC transporter ATP-binding protein [Anaerolineae bacterium]